MVRSEIQARGRTGEDLAANHLALMGMEIVERNYRFGHAEIDIIARDGGTLVFCEVKARASKRFGDPLYAITPRKQAQIRHVASGYLFEHQIGRQSCRFDVITVRFVAGRPVLTYLRNAF